MDHAGMKKAIAIAVFIIIALSGCTLRKEIVIPRTEVQELVSRKFPYDKDIGIARVIVQDPQVYFEGKNIGLKAIYQGSLLGKKVMGSIDVNGNIVYKPETGVFYLYDFVVAGFTINENSFIEKGNLQEVVNVIIGNRLNGFPIYRLDPKDFNQNLGLLLVKDVFVRNDDLVVVLGK